MSTKKVPNVRDVLYFFENPTFPCFLPKGTQKQVALKVPASYVDKKYLPSYKSMFDIKPDAATGRRLNIQELPKLPAEYDNEPDISYIRTVDPRANFSTFNPHHTKVAAYVIETLWEVDIKYFLSLVAKIQVADVNPYLLNYALLVTMAHRSELRQIPVPSPATCFPEFYLSSDVINQSLSAAKLPRTINDKTYLEIKPSATDVDVENRVAYFREDIGYNLHHYHWHVIYPFGSDNAKLLEIMNKDRRGELFIYMHAQILARFNSERFCNKLNRVVSFHNLSEPIPQAYFPKLTSLYTAMNFAVRPANMTLNDINRDGMNFKIIDMEIWRNRIYDACQSGYYWPAVDNETKDSDRDTDRHRPGPVRGHHHGHHYGHHHHDPVNTSLKKLNMDILGKMVEPTIYSPNLTYYGNLHNNGHVIIAYAHDPDNRYLENFGVIGNNMTSARDPIFYRWHAFIDDICEEYRKILKMYTVTELTFNGITIKKLEVTTKKNPQIGIPQDVKNVLYTFNEKDKLDLTNILDPDDPSSIYVLFNHVQHQEFEYNITIQNTSPAAKTGTVRIFMAPTESEDHNRMDLEKQRRLFFELDRFPCEIKPRSDTTISRSSKNSVLTVPLKQLIVSAKEIQAAETKPTEGAYCGCGWPQYMLIPRGTTNGINFTLFAMVTNYDDDITEGKALQPCDKDQKLGTNCKTGLDGTAFSYCGLQSMKYPDRKPMGYPFDRPLHEDVVATVELNGIPNMRTQDVVIKYLEGTYIDGETMTSVPKDATIIHF